MQLNPQPFLACAYTGLEHVADSFIQQFIDCLFNANSLVRC